MEFSGNAKTMLMMGAGIALLALVYGIPILLQAVEPSICTIDGQCQHEIFANEIIKAMPFVLLIGIVLGATGYYFFSEKKMAEKPALDRDALYSLLGPDERAVFEKIVQEGGKLVQSELSGTGGMNKVRIHRVLAKMYGKGILVKEERGKTNLVRLSESLRKMIIG